MSRHGVVRGLVLMGVVLVTALSGVAPASACTPGDEVVFDDVVALDGAGGGADHVVGVVERRVVAEAPAVPILTSRRAVSVPTRTWGDVSGTTLGVWRSGEYLHHLLMFVSFCGGTPLPRAGDATMVAVLERSDGSVSTWSMVEEPYRFDPTFAGGLTPDQETALTARFGVPEELDGPSVLASIGWSLRVWLPWFVTAGGAFAVLTIVVRARDRQDRADSASVAQLVQT